MIIYDINNNKILDAILTDSAEHEEELGKTNLVRLSWYSNVKLTLPAGSYVIPFGNGLKYRLFTPFTPIEDSNGFKYEPEFHHPLMLLSCSPFLYKTTDSDKNPIMQQEWSYDGLTTNALDYACEAINDALGITEKAEQFTYSLCGDVDASVSFSVSSSDILSVLSSIAQACKSKSCEWHLSWEHKSLYFGQISVNLGEPIPTLKVHENIQQANLNGSKDGYFNCFYPQGATRNMSKKAIVGSGNFATLLCLGLDKKMYPDGFIYVNTDGEVITKEEFNRSNVIRQTLALSFDDVYPHIDLYAYNIRKRVRYLKNNQTGQIELDNHGNKKTYSVWYMRLAFPSTTRLEGKEVINTTEENGTTYYWYHYHLDKAKQVLQGHNLKGFFKVNTHSKDNSYDVLSQSLVGQPNGQEGFELIYHEVNKTIPENSTEGDSGVSIIAGDYEIKMYQSNNVIIPTNESEGLFPRGKKRPDFTCNVVVLFNIVMGESELKRAQNELATRTMQEIRRMRLDTSNYSFFSNAVEFKENNPNLYIGKKVIFNDGSGYQIVSRVIKIITKLNSPVIQNITIGNKPVKGAISELKEHVSNILSGNFSGGGLNSTQVNELIKNYSDSRFLSKIYPDKVAEEVTFVKGLIAGNGKERIVLNDNGCGSFEDLTVEGGLKSVNFNRNTLQGFSFSKDDDGHYSLQLKNLEVFGKAIFNVLEERKRTYMGGSSVFTCAGSTLTRVEDITIDNSLKGWRCYFYADNGTTTTQNTWQIGDMALCETFNTYGGNKRYWRKVTMVGSDYIELSKDDAEQNSDTPTVGDVVVQYGNDRSKERQGIIEIRAIGENAPEILIYAGVNQYSLKGKEKVLISPKAVRIDANLFELTATDGQTAKIEEWIRNAGKVNENLLHNTINFSDGKGWDLVNQNLYRGEVSQEVLFNGMRTLKVLLDPGIATIDDNLVYVNYDDVFTLSAWVYYVGEKPLQHKGNTPLLTVCLNDNGTAFWDFEEIAHTNTENDDIYQNGNIPKNKWVRVVRSFRVKVRDAHKMQVIIYDTSNKGTMYVGSIKLERGLQVTDNIPNFREIEDKAVRRAEKGITLQSEKLNTLTGKLKKAGIHIDSEEVSISGEKISIKDTNNKDIALFKDGKVNAELIEAGTLRSVGKDGTEVNIENGLAHFTKKGTHAGVHIGVDKNGIPTFIGTDGANNVLWMLGQGGLSSRAENAEIILNNSNTIINTFEKPRYRIVKYVSLFVTNKGFKEFLFTDKDIEVRITNRKGEWETMSCTSRTINVNEKVLMEYTFSEKFYSVDPISTNGYYTFKYEVWYHNEKVLSGTNEKGIEDTTNDLMNYLNNNRNRFNNG